MKRISDSQKSSSNLMGRQRASSIVWRSGSGSPLHDSSKQPTSAQPKSGSHLDLTRESEDPGRDTLSDEDKKKCAGTRYITEDLIKKMTKHDNLAFVQSLTLSNIHGGKRFRYIENLDKCDRLQVLNLSYNGIEKIENLEKLHKLRELHLSNNSIQKIEGLEHMVNLQVLNLANNQIKQVPLWLSKKLRSLQILNLQNNEIFSLHELAKLKLLKNLTELMLAENPVSDIAHYRSFLVFHLRSLKLLDGQFVSEQEREKAHQRFHTEEVERLEQELEEKRSEIEHLQRERDVALNDLEQQEKLYQDLKQQAQDQERQQEQLERELNTKSELLKQKTAELTWACQKQYDLEQDLAFHKIDAKFEPLPFYSDHLEGGQRPPGESPYIGKARYKRRTPMTDSIDARSRDQATDGLLHRESPMGDASRNAVMRAEERLQQLHKEIERAEQHILKASEELRQLEEAASQKNILEAEKEQLRQQLQGKIQRLGKLRQEAEAMERQLDRQRAELSQAQGELEQLQSLLSTLEPQDPKHAHVKAQVTSKSQLLAIMSRKHRELEERLDDMLTRIAKETQEIKDLEQQLTEGQIAANEALKKDLEGIILGLQEYLRGVKDQAHQARSDCLRLQRERDALQRTLQDKEQQLHKLQDCENAKEELLQHQEEVEGLRRENAELRKAQTQAQCQASAYEAELEGQLQDRDAETRKLKEELIRHQRLSQLEHSALQAELQKERQAKENALTRLQMAAERELENTELLEELNTLQREKGDLLEQVSAMQNDLMQVKRELLCPKQVSKRLEALRRSICTGKGEVSRVSGEGDVMGESLTQLQKELNRTVAAALQERDEAQRGQDKLSREVDALRGRLQKYQSTRREAEQARAAERRVEEAELLQLREELQKAREREYLTQQRLKEAESERDRLLTELEEQDQQMKAEENQTREQLQCLDLELQDLRRSFTAADQMTAQQLHVAKDQLRSLQSTVQKINQERTEDAEELEESRIQAAQAMHDLTQAEAEIHALQKMLQDRAHVLDIGGSNASNSGLHQDELARLNRALKRQQAQTKRLREELAQVKEDNSGNLEDLLKDIDDLKDSLLQQNNYLTSLRDAPHSAGYWYYVPPRQNMASLSSQGTQDSGLGSQHPPSPRRGRQSRSRQRKDTGPPSNAGYWVYSPAPHDTPAHGRRDPPCGDSNGESDEDGFQGSHFTPPPGSVIYTVPPDGTPLPSGMVIYAPPLPGLSICPGAVFHGPPPDGVRLVYGPPPRGLHTPVFPNGTLHCNVPGHQDLESSLREAERSLREQQSGKATCERELLRLEEQRSALELELKKLQRSMTRLQRHNSFSLAEEQGMIAELESVEKTLLKRKTELRETEHLLMEAEADLKTARARTKDVMQQCSEAEQRLKDTECELEEIKHQTQDSTRQLTLAKQQLRGLQEDMRDLQKRKKAEESALQRIEEMITARNKEDQEVNKKMEKATKDLEGIKKQLKETQSLETKILKSYRDSEEVLNQRTKELAQLNNQMHLQQQELSLLGRNLVQWREEEGILRASKEHQKQGLVVALRQGEEDTHVLQLRIKELHADTQALTVQKEELDSQISERKSRLAQYKKEEEREKETVQKLRSVLSKHKAELNHVLDMIQLESAELDRVKVQNRQKLEQKEKNEEDLQQVYEELQTVQQELREQQAELDRQQSLHEKKSLALREQIDAAEAQRTTLEEECASLEARHAHAQRSLEAAEAGARTAEAELLKLKTELSNLKQEHRHAQSLKEKHNRDMNTTQKQLDEHSEELSKLLEQVAHSRLNLKEITEEVGAARRERDDLLKQQRDQESEQKIRNEHIQRRQQKADKLEQKLKELEAAVARKEAQLKQQEERLRTQQQQSLELEELQAQQQQKLKSQLQALEGAVAQHVEKMEQVTTAVEELEERRRFLHAEHQHCTGLQDRASQLEQELAEMEAKLHASTDEVRDMREELEACRSDVRRLQETLSKERRRAEAQVEALKSRRVADKDKLKQAEKEQDRLQRELAMMGQVTQQSQDRAKGLQLELNTASQELLCLKDKLQIQKEGEICLKGKRSDVVAELDAGSSELELEPLSSTDTERDEENQLSTAMTIKKAAFNTTDEQWRGEVLREKLRQQEDQLKAQLRRSMFSQQEALSVRRQQTEGSIRVLQRRVDKLDQLLSKSSHHSYSRDSESLTIYSCPDESWRPHASGDWPYKPHRLDSSIPEKDLSHTH